MTAAAPAVILLEDLRRLGPLGRFEALLASPDVPGWLLAEPVVFAREDPLFGYACGIEGCEGHSTQAGLWCTRHAKQRWAALKAGVTESAWGSAAVPFAASPGWGGDSPLPACRFCPDRDAVSEGICVRHKVSRDYARKRDGAGFDEASWAARQHSLPGAGACLAGGCQGRAELSPALCRRHRAAWQRAGSPQGGEFTGWLSRAEGWGGRGVLVLERLPPLAAAEIRYGLFAHTLEPAPARWHPMWLRTLVRSCLERGAVSLLELDPGEGGWTRQPASVNRILRDLLRHARSVHRTREETREDGCLDPGYWGVRFPNRRSAFDLTAIPQRWLRDLGWDYLASVLEGPGRPRTAGPFEQARRSLVCLGAYLHDRAPLQGERPGMLTAETARGFTADFRQRVTAARPVRGVFNVDGSPSLAAESTYSVTMNAVRKVMRWSLEHDRPDGPPREFIVAFPAGQAKARRNPRPFSDPVLQVLGDPANLALLAGRDPNDNGVADIWRVQLRCGRRIGEVVNLRFDCVSEHLGRTWLWVDMTKVGKLDYAIQIPRDVYDLIRARQDKTTARFRAKFGRSPSAGERRAIALFPSRVANPAFERAVSIATFPPAFHDWLGCDGVDLPRPHPPPAPPHPGHPPSRRRRQHGARQEGPRARLRSDERGLRPHRRGPGRALPAAGVGERPRRRRPRRRRPAAHRGRQGCRRRPAARPRRHPHRARAVHLQTGRGRSGLPLLQAMPHLRAFRSHRSRLQLLETPGATAGGARRRRPQPRSPRLPLPGVRAELPSHRRAGKSPRGRRPARRG